LVFEQFITIGLVLYGAGLSVWLLGRRFIPDRRVPLLGLLNTVLHLLLLPVVITLPIALFLRHPWAALAQLIPFAYTLREYGLQVLPRRPAAATSTAFTVMTYNIHKETRFLDPIVTVIRSAQADVVAFQELSVEAAAYFQEHLREQYPFMALHPDGVGPDGQGVLSRCPLCDDSYWIHDAPRNAMGQQRVELEVHGRRLVLYNTHPLHPGMGDIWFDTAIRGQEIDRILQRIETESLPVILCGDFNMPDQSDDYRLITRSLRDAFRAAGQGLGWSWPDLSQPQSLPVSMFGVTVREPLPVPQFMRLDYVFHSAHFQAIHARVWPDAGGSDHRPVLARLDWLR
jgi:vancomycin resistance protein VanJ